MKTSLEVDTIAFLGLLFIMGLIFAVTNLMVQFGA